jgi:putative membrane protein
VLLVAGLSRAVYFEKGSAYYFQNSFFVAKLILFMTVALMSIYPTVVFLSWRKPLQAGLLPHVTDSQVKRIRMLMYLELTGVVGILLCAPLMARGIG